MEEIWKQVPFLDFYEASNFGRIRSLDHYAYAVPCNRKAYKVFIRGKILKTTIKKERYSVVTIREISGKNQFTVHELVCAAFHGLRPEGKWALHKDDDPRNNKEDNLYWGSQFDNISDAINNGRIAIAGRKNSGVSHGNSKLSESDVISIRMLSEAGRTGISLAKEFSVCAATISQIINRKNWDHI